MSEKSKLEKLKDSHVALEKRMDAMQRQIDELSGVRAARKEIQKLKHGHAHQPFSSE